MMASILSFLKAIPGVLSLLESLKNMWKNLIEKKIDHDFDKKRDERDKLIIQLHNAKTDEERRKLVKYLNSIN